MGLRVGLKVPHPRDNIAARPALRMPTCRVWSARRGGSHLPIGGTSAAARRYASSGIASVVRSGQESSLGSGLAMAGKVAVAPTGGDYAGCDRAGAGRRAR